MTCQSVIGGKRGEKPVHSHAAHDTHARATVGVTRGLPMTPGSPSVVVPMPGTPSWRKAAVTGRFRRLVIRYHPSHGCQKEESVPASGIVP
jgi:hypothetical protein